MASLTGPRNVVFPCESNEIFQSQASDEKNLMPQVLEYQESSENLPNPKFATIEEMVRNAAANIRHNPLSHSDQDSSI